MPHNHSHSHSHPHPTGSSNQHRLVLALILAAVYMVVEFLAGLFTGSLALLADAGHMLTDVAALSLSLFATMMARRPATSTRTYGYHRTEILVALANGATLLIIAAIILKEAWERFAAPPPIPGHIMMIVATGGLAINLIALWILHTGPGQNLNMRGAYLHVLSDALGSIGAIIAGALILTLQWWWADPAISAIIAILVAISSINLVRQSLAVLMEGAPSGINADKIKTELQALPHVQQVHDLHVWTITTGLDSLSVHLEVQPNTDAPARDKLLTLASATLQEKFGIKHTTIQIAPAELNSNACAIEDRGERMHKH